MTDLWGNDREPEQEFVERNEPDWNALALEAGSVFTPHAPIDERSLFSGRLEQVRRVVDAVAQKGQHVILFGERGVGKTSLANVLSQFFGRPTGVILAQRVNCDSSDSFDSVWRKIFDRIDMASQRHVLGFAGETRESSLVATELFGEAPITPDAVARVLASMAANSLPVLIFDEFDRLPHEPRHAFADTVKNLSDHAVSATVLIVGVADSVDDLIEEHQSIARAVRQIQMPRMAEREIGGILSTGLERLGMNIEADAMRKITTLARGLPHYAHLIGLHASRAALDSHSLLVTTDAVDIAIAAGINDAAQSVRTAYHKAIRSARKDSLFADVLLACALAEPDELGYFAAQDVRDPIRAITGREYGIPAFAQHLKEFCEPKRGRILFRSGEKRSYRYRFADPLMQPFVIMQGVADGRMQRVRQP